jgi:hypothetical protein
VEIDPVERQHFVEIAKTELVSPYVENFARYQIRPPKFEAWQDVWETR